MENLKEPPVIQSSSFSEKIISKTDLNRLDLLRLAYEHYGEIFYVPSDDGNNTLIMAGQDVNKFVSTEGKDFFSSVEFWQGTLVEMECPHSFIGVDGEAHQYQRSLMQPMFARAYFKNKLDSLIQIAHTEIEQYEDVGQKKLHVAPFLRRILSKQIGSTLQGDMPENEDIEAMMNFQVTAINVCSLKKWPESSLSAPKYVESKKRAKEFANRIIERARNEKNTERYLDYLMMLGEKEHPEWFTHGDLENHAMIPYLAGIDTVGSTLGFMLHELIKHPELKSRLQDEVDTFFSGNEISLSTMSNMKQLNAFVKEVLRLYPTAFAIRRTVSQDFEYKGYKVAKGQEVTIFTTADHTNPQYFDKPFEINIDRYLDGHSTLATGVLSHFGKGPHTCLGSGLANVLIPLNLAHIMYTLDIEADENFDDINVECSPLLNLDPMFSLIVKSRCKVDLSVL